MKHLSMEEIEALLVQHTDSLELLDRKVKAAKMGVEMVPCMRCSESGLFYPPDYGKEWGRLYGIGLGPYVCSESLQSDYETPPPQIGPQIKKLEQIMHPLGNCRGQMDFHLVEAGEMLLHTAILAIDDPDMELRAKILREKQMANPKGQLKLMAVAWERAGRTA
jgi:hypothetical protein